MNGDPVDALSVIVHKDKAAQRAFMAGIAYANKADEMDAKDEAPAEEAEDKCKDTAQDSAPVFDKNMAAALYTAAEEVAPHIGKIANPFAFDSAAEIYKKALDAKGISVDGVDPSAFGVMVRMIQTAPTMPEAVDDDPMNDILRGIKSR
mgnify:CR=1 FL=1